MRKINRKRGTEGGTERVTHTEKKSREQGEQGKEKERMCQREGETDRERRGKQGSRERQKNTEGIGI